MKERRRWIAVLILSTAGIVALMAWTAPILVQARAQEADNDQPPRVYNPYPPGILPANLSSEIARVFREVDLIESRALARCHALTPPILIAHPPVLQNTGTEPLTTLSDLMLITPTI